MASKRYQRLAEKIAAGYASAQGTSGSFRKRNGDFESSSARLNAIWWDLSLSTLEEHFGIPKEDGKAALDTIYGMNLYYAKHYELLRCLSDSESHQGRCIERMARVYGDLKEKFDGLDNPHSEKLCNALPEVQKSLEDYTSAPKIVAAMEALERYFDFLSPKNPMRVLEVISRSQNGFSRHYGALFDPANTEELKKCNFRWITEMVDRIAIFRDPAMKNDYERFMGYISRQADAFLQEARERKSSEPIDQLAVFKSMCFALVASNTAYAISARSKMSIVDMNMLSYSIDECPCLLLHDDAVLDRLVRISRQVHSHLASQLLSRNPQWVVPGAGLDELEKLVSRLDDCDHHLLRIIDGRSLQTANKVLDRIKERPDLLEFYKDKLVSTKDAVDTESFVEYILDVCDRKVGGETFHAILVQAADSLGQTARITTVEFAEEIYLSDLWEDIALLAIGNEDDRRHAWDAICAISWNEFGRAKRIVERRIGELEKEKAASIEEKVKGEYRDADPAQVAAICAIYKRLDRLGLEPESYSTIRKKGLVGMLAMAEGAASLNDASFSAAFNNKKNVKMLSKALAYPESTDLLERLNQIDTAAEPKDAAERVAFETERFVDDCEAIRRGEYNRIVLVSGEKVARSIVENLAKQTPLEIKVVSNELATKSYLGSVLKPGDAIIIETSHISHSASGTAIAICRSRGIPFFICSITNAGRINQLLKTKSNGNGRSIATGGG